MENLKYERARRRVEEEKGFYNHLFVYAVFVVFFFILNQLTARAQWWYWPTLGWGIGVFSHFMGTFGKPWILGKNWEDRRMRTLMEQDTEHEQSSANNQ
jgi:hypothetical protein